MAKDTRTNEIIYVQNLQFGTLFDSGATHSACSTSTAARLHALGITVLPSTFPIRNADGGSMKVRGMLQMKFMVQQRTFKWDFFVVDNLDNEVIIGADFMKPHKVLLDMANSKVIFPDSCETRQINAVYKSMIPENHHVKIQCQISAAQNIQLKPGSLTVTKRREILPGVFLEEVLTKVLNRNRIFVVITNNNPYQVCIKPSQILGETVDIEAKIVPVDEAKISAFNTNVTTGRTSTCTPEKEEYLKQNLNCPTEGNLHVQYEELILRNHDVFAKDKYDLGFSDAVSHKINMKNSQPVYIKQFRIPDAHQDVILDHIKEWQNKNVIEECSSPYIPPLPPL